MYQEKIIREYIKGNNPVAQIEKPFGSHDNNRRDFGQKIK